MFGEGFTMVHKNFYAGTEKRSQRRLLRYLLFSRLVKDVTKAFQQNFCRTRRTSVATDRKNQFLTDSKRVQSSTGPSSRTWTIGAIQTVSTKPLWIEPDPVPGRSGARRSEALSSPTLQRPCVKQMLFECCFFCTETTACFSSGLENIPSAVSVLSVSTTAGGLSIFSVRRRAVF